MSSNNSIIPGFDDELDDSLKITLDAVPSIDKAIRIELNGYIDTYNSNFFQGKISKVVEAGFTKLIFICENLSYVSSTGIGSFTSFLKILKPKGGDVILVSIQAKVYEVFQLLGFSQFFTIKNSFEEALQGFGNFVPAAESVFPKIFSCPVCQKKLKAPKAGRFRCSQCKNIISLNEKGEVSLG